MINLFDHFTKVAGVYEVDSSTMYPAMALHVQEVLATGVRAYGPLAGYYDAAQEVDKGAWQYIGTPVERVPPEKVNSRAICLELCRLWFTEMLHQTQGGGPMSVHLVDPGKKFKLFETKTELRSKEATLLNFLGLKVMRSR